MHIWYLKGRPSYLSVLLNFNRKQTEALVYCTESILNTIFPKEYNSILYPYDKSTLFRSKNRLLQPLKTKLFTDRFNLFALHLVDFDFFFIEQYFLDLEKQRLQLKKRNNIAYPFNIKKINLNKKSIIKKNNVSKKICISSPINSFLSERGFWELSNIKHAKKKTSFDLKKWNSTFKSQKFKYEDNYFLQSYYSISKHFCWHNQVKNAHFLYYMTSLPAKKDIKLNEYLLFTKYKSNKKCYDPQAGAGVFNNLLKNLNKGSKRSNLFALERQLRINLFEMNEFSSLGELFQKVKLLRRLKLVWYFRVSLNKPSWMILSILPVLPPDLRPIIQLEGNQIAISDLNKLYQKVLFRNNRIQKLKIGHYSQISEESQYAQRLLQEAVDSLIENGKGGGAPSSTLNGRPLKSLSDILKGKKGRFRQNLLGKRVDYSGRSVIVVGPHLRVHECGLPYEMAVELFQPFLIRRLIFEKKVRTILGAKQLIHEGGPIIRELLFEIMQNHPVLLNRAPTLHRLSIQSFQPRLVEGRAIILHPLVCSAFNADFDGDQMAVHVPLSYQARAEAWKLLWSQNNLLSPATGQPILVPSQDIVLGWYFLTAFDSKNFFANLLNNAKGEINLSKIEQIFKIKKIDHFYRLKTYKKTIHVLSDYEQKKINIHTPIWFTWKGLIETDKNRHSTIEVRLNSTGQLFLCSHQFKILYNWYGFKINQAICTTAGRVLLNYLTQKNF